jgi:hypothetical protein
MHNAGGIDWAEPGSTCTNGRETRGEEGHPGHQSHQAGTVGGDILQPGSTGQQPGASFDEEVTVDMTGHRVEPMPTPVPPFVAQPCQAPLR